MCYGYVSVWILKYLVLPARLEPDFLSVCRETGWESPDRLYRSLADRFIKVCVLGRGDNFLMKTGFFRSYILLVMFIATDQIY